MIAGTFERRDALAFARPTKPGPAAARTSPGWKRWPSPRGPAATAKSAPKPGPSAAKLRRPGPRTDRRAATTNVRHAKTVDRAHVPDAGDAHADQRRRPQRRPAGCRPSSGAHATTCIGSTPYAQAPLARLLEGPPRRRSATIIELMVLPGAGRRPAAARAASTRPHRRTPPSAARPRARRRP